MEDASGGLPISEGSLSTIERESFEASTMKDEEWDVLDQKALGMIRLCLEAMVAFNISMEKTTVDLMEKLGKLYEKPSASNKVYLMKSLFNMKMSDGDSVNDHLNEFNMVTNQLSSVGVSFDDEVRDLLILCSLPESWNTLVMVVSNSISGSNTLKFDDVIGVILSEEMRRKSTGESSGNALSVENRGRQKEKEKGPGHRGKSKKGRSKSRRRMVCWNCGKAGHAKKDCWSLKSGKDQQEGSKEENIAGDVLQDALILSLDSKLESWVLDSGASFHATPHRQYFQDYVQGNFGQVYLGDDEPCNIVGKGSVHVKLQNGNTWVLKNVRHVPSLRRNLISVGKLGDEGCMVIFTTDSWKVTKGSLVVARGKKVGTLYLSTVSTDPSSILATTGIDTTLWHHRLGHMSEKGMKILHSQGKLSDLKNIDLDFCEHCVYGKQKRVRFLKVGSTKKEHKLELVHTDVWGPTQVSSLGGSRYYVTFIDDATRKVWVYCIKKKSDVFNTFKKWKALVENETGLKLKCLRSDNGGEYCNNEFNNYCSQNGIRRVKTVPRTPQQNGVSERMNKTIMECARSMRLHVGFPLQFWVDAVDIVVYLINRGPSSALEGGVPEEAWTSKEVNYSFLKVFGCEAFVHIDKENRTKLEAKSKKCTFIGYGTDDFGFWLWSLDEKKIIRSRDVIFNERVMYREQLQDKKLEKSEYVALDEIKDREVLKGLENQQVGINPGTVGVDSVDQNQKNNKSLKI
ncbi:hypothetical protein KI387_040625 [Taxus chinensis]|uniref:Retrovirus-related Pol polyprotein from transposon TNT 1-94 n=1 Tax=Taxus chinensis TaxID=29808 RepID=A0AA38F9B2_TAXCH|nr:hypothetical protein KI387_040625 [Taxus chinensis]